MPFTLPFTDPTLAQVNLGRERRAERGWVGVGVCVCVREGMKKDVSISYTMPRFLVQGFQMIQVIFSG